VGVFGFSQPGIVPFGFDRCSDRDCEDRLMEYAMFYPPLWVAAPVSIWLAILSYFDWKTRQIPQIAWVFLPCLAAITYRVLSGGGALAALAAVTILASERGRLPTKWRRAGTTLAAPVIILLIWMGGMPLVTISLAVIGFWLAWELHAWGGADTLTAIALLLLWPDIRFLVAVLAIHLVVVVSLQIVRRKQPHNSGSIQWIPGIPLLMISTFSYLLWSYMQNYCF
jgi:hypothetical protein